jgi:hypothetical protein
MASILQRLWIKKSNEAKVVQKVADKPKAVATSRCIKMIVQTMKASNLSDSMPRFMFERALVGFSKDELEATKLYLIKKGLFFEDKEHCRMLTGFYGCAKCSNCRLAQNWHERTMCGKDRVLTVISTYAGKQGCGFSPKELVAEYAENWKEG